MDLDVGVLDSVTQEFLRAFRQDAYQLQHIASTVFIYLVTIQLAVTSIGLTLSGASLQQLFIKNVQIAIVFACFYAGITHGGQWIPQLLNGFIEIGKQGGLTALSPSTIIDQGVAICHQILSVWGVMSIFTHAFAIFITCTICIAVLIIYAFMAAELCIVLVKCYFMIAVSSLFFAFGGNEITRPLTINYLKTVVGLGLQLMSLYLILGVGVNLGEQWTQTIKQASTHHQLLPVLIIFSAIIVLYLMLKNIPPFVASLVGVGGFRNYGDEAIATTMHTSMQASRITQKIAFKSGTAIKNTAGAASNYFTKPTSKAKPAPSTPPSQLGLTPNHIKGKNNDPHS